MSELILLVRTKGNQISREGERKIRDVVMPMAGVVTSGKAVMDPKWLGKKLKKRKKVLACIFDNHKEFNVYGSIGGPTNELADVLLAAEEGKTSWEVVSGYAAEKDEKYRRHLERYKRESPDGLWHE